MDIKLNKLEIRTIILNGIFNLGYGLSTMFLNVYLYAYTGSLITMSLYTIIRIGLFPFFFIWGCKLTKKHEFVLTYAIGLTLVTLSLLYALLGSKLFEINGNYVLIVAAITGVGEGFYWFSSNTCNQVVTTMKSRPKFLSISGIVSNISNLLVPIISTFLISISETDLAGNRKILIVAIISYISVIFVSFSLKKKSEDKDISILKALSLKDKVWADHILGVIGFGLKDSITLTLSGILLYNAVGSGGIYSKLQILFAFITIIAYRFLTQALSKVYIRKTFIIGIVLTMSSILALVYLPNMFGGIYFGIANALSSVFYSNCYNYISANIIARYKDEMTARVVAKETYLSISRCMGMVLIIVLYKIIKTDIYLPISVSILSLAPILLYKKYSKYI